LHVIRRFKIFRIFSGRYRNRRRRFGLRLNLIAGLLNYELAMLLDSCRRSNGWNRITITTRMVPGTYEPQPLHGSNWQNCHLPPHNGCNPYAVELAEIFLTLAKLKLHPIATAH
jgi:hypothetical protein